MDIKHIIESAYDEDVDESTNAVFQDSSTNPPIRHFKVKGEAPPVPLVGLKNIPRHEDYVRACDGCRRVKEKCDGGVPCRRCIRYHRQCVNTTTHYTPDQKSPYNFSSTVGELEQIALEQERRRQGTNQDVEKLVVDGVDIRNPEQMFPFNISENADVFSIEENKTYDFDFGKSKPEETEDTRREDRYANFPLMSQKDSSNAAMAEFQRHARDIETASRAANQGSPRPLSPASSASDIDSDEVSIRGLNPGGIVIKCLCSSNNNPPLILCRLCDTWQHSECYYHGKDVPEQHYCTDCVDSARLRDYIMEEIMEEGGSRVTQDLFDSADPADHEDSLLPQSDDPTEVSDFTTDVFDFSHLEQTQGTNYQYYEESAKLWHLVPVDEEQVEQSPVEKTVQIDYILPQSTAEAYTDSGYASNTARPAKPLQAHTQVSQAETVSAEISCNQERTDVDDDTRSIYSDASSLPALKKTGYMNELADELAQAVQSYQLSSEIRDRIFEVLPELLKAFALSFGHPSANAMQRDVMVFIHRYRRDIVTTLNDHLLTEDVDKQNNPSKDKMSLNDIMSLWDRSGLSAENHDPNDPGFDEIERPDMMETEDEVDEIDENELPCLEAYRSLIRDSPGYSWLLDNLRRECVLAPAEPNVIGEIRNTILKALPSSSRISRRKHTDIFEMGFMVEWDPIAFLRDEEYTEEPETAIERAITWTCSNTAAQALTCGEYLRQTWPSTGEHMLKLIKSLVSGKSKAWVICSDGTTLNASSQQFHTQGSPSFCIDTRGTAASIAEIGEQLAWLTSAVRSSPYAHEVAYSRPFVDFIQVGHVTYEETPKITYMCKIGVEIRQRELGTETTNGQCWHSLFRTPVVVEGFPIPRRTEENYSGIEIPLNIMAALTQTRRVHNLAGRTLLKGFADMIIPMKCSQGMVTWHLVHSKNGERISYLESDNFPKVDIQIGELEKSRHILGWCPQMKTYAGAIDACYEVKNSRLPRPTDRGGLVDALLSSGHFVMGGTPFSVGRKDIRLRRNSYIMKIRWVSQRFVILWDVGEKRGWLVNGASALLHLVRGSLAQDQFDSRFGSLSQYKTADFEEALKLHQTDAALEVLLNQNNLQAKIYSEDEEHIRFKDYVEDFYDVLEKMVDFQFKAFRTVNTASTIPRSLLEGWDFNDLTTGRDPIYPRQALLHQDGLSWVDFTRSVHAITLFGRGFGEVIQPTRVTCSSWKKLPKGKSYLAASVTDLHNIMESDGDPYSIPVKLTHNILWYTPDETFAQCRCETDEKRCDLAHILLPFRLQREMSSIRSQLPEKGGAVIFGTSSARKWFWGDVGDPTRTPSENLCLSTSSSSIENEKRDANSDDSGIGKSLDSSASRTSELVMRSLASQYDEEYSGSTHAGISESEDYTPSIQTKSHRSEHHSPLVRRYHIGIVCALHLELMAVRMLFDETHDKVDITDGDPNYYALGSMAGHNVVAVCLPHGQYGTNVAADVTSNMKRSFPTLKFCLLVGIGAGVPSPKNDIRLGDVVICAPKGGYSGVLPYDMIKSCESGVSELNGYLCPPPSHLMCAISELESDPSLSSTPLQKSLQQIESCKEQYKYPGAIHDQLFTSQYVHQNGHDTCDQCDTNQEIKRPPRFFTHPKIHYGLIASGNQVMRSAQIRDRLSREHNVLCFEMEGAGIMNSFPCLIIRGICDYADSHKNKQWQNYAAAVAAAYAKLLLSRLRDSNYGFDGGLSESTSDYRQRSNKRRLSAESNEEAVGKREKAGND